MRDYVANLWKNLHFRHRDGMMLRLSDKLHLFVTQTKTFKIAGQSSVSYDFELLYGPGRKITERFNIVYPDTVTVTEATIRSRAMTWALQYITEQRESYQHAEDNLHRMLAEEPSYEKAPSYKKEETV